MGGLPVRVYLEVGRKRVFACALDWPGWCRSGRDQDSALEALVAAGPRFRVAIGPPARAFDPPSAVSALGVVEEVEGNATTDFGAPGVAPASDERPLDDAELGRLERLLRACWEAFDVTAEAHASAVLRKGPRGGGRDLDAIVSHVLEADRAYLSGLGGSYRKGVGDPQAETTGVRAALLEALVARAHGEPLPLNPRRSAPVWLPRYAVRRSAWHAIDHAWEIEDRAEDSA